MYRTLERAAAALMLCLACGAPAGAQPATPDPGRWFKGNTHSHAKTWLPIPHGDSSPRRMARWYKERGYQFLCLSDHNQAGREERAERLVDAGFVLVSGTEVTTDTRLMPLYHRRHPGAPDRVVHTTALGIDPDQWDEAVWRDFSPSSTVEEILTTHRRASEGAGGISILNHPNFRDPIGAQDVIGAGLRFFEVYNAYPHSDNEGDATHPSTEALWDQVLSAGHVLYGLASDDAHHTKRWNRRLTEAAKIRAEPGGGFIMVRAAALTPQALLSAIRAGEFYASSGVHLATLSSQGGRLSLAVDVSATHAELAQEWVWKPAPAAPAGAQPGLEITFVTRHGRVAATVSGPVAELPLSAAEGYLRARVRVVVSRGGETRAFYAWTQPVFTSPAPAPPGPSAPGLTHALPGQ